MPKRQCQDWLTDWMSYCERIESPTVYKSWVGMFTLAAVLERKCWTVWDKVIFPNLYILLVGSAAARKGTAMRPGLRLLVPLAQNGHIHLASDAGSMQALFEEMVENATEVPCYPPEMNTTQMSSLTAFSEEFSTMMGSSNLDYCNSLTALYDCADPKGEWKYRTKTMGVSYVQGPWLNLIGAIQPEMLPKVFPPEVITGGLASRFVMVFGEEAQPEYFPVRTPEEEALFQRLAHDLDIIRELSGPFTITEDWLEPYVLWRKRAQANPPLRDHQFQAYLGRRPTHIIKLCMVLSASRDNRKIIDAEIFERATALLHDAESRMSRVYEGHGATSWAQYVPALIRFLKRDGEQSLSNVSAQFYKDLNPWEQRTMLAQLQNRKLVQCFVGLDGRQWVRLWPMDVNGKPMPIHKATPAEGEPAAGEEVKHEETV